MWRRSSGWASPVTGVELARYPEPLAPATAALRAGLPPVGPQDIAEAAAKLAASHDLVLVEGAGGLLVRFDADGHTLADAARLAEAPVLVVAQAGLGTLNATALTTLALRSYGLDSPGVVIGSWLGRARSRLPLQSGGPPGRGGRPAPRPGPGGLRRTRAASLPRGGPGLAGVGARGIGGIPYPFLIRRGPVGGPRRTPARPTAHRRAEGPPRTDVRTADGVARGDSLPARWGD